jgi:hypothetical protein
MDLSYLSLGKFSRDRLVKIAFIIIAIIIIGLFFSLTDNKSSYRSGSTGGMMAPSMGFANNAVRAVAYEKSVSGGYPQSADAYLIEPPLPSSAAGSPDFPAERKVIRTGSLAVVVTDVSRSAKDISDLSTRLGGWIENQNIYEYNSGTLQGELTVRVPEGKFTEALAQIKLLAVRVQREQINSSDVSAQVVDLESRLKNERAREAQYLIILKDAKKVTDILEVTNMLSNVRGTIEQIEGQINYLARQTSMSTISVSLTPVANAKDVTDEWRPGLVAKESLKNLLVSLTSLVSGIIIFVIQVLPLLLIQLGILALVGVIVWKLAKKLFVRLGGALPPKQG